MLRSKSCELCGKKLKLLDIGMCKTCKEKDNAKGTPDPDFTERKIGLLQ
jgi:hypothetical protein